MSKISVYNLNFSYDGSYEKVFENVAFNIISYFVPKNKQLLTMNKIGGTNENYKTIKRR